VIVVDTNVIAYLLLPGAWTAAAEKLFLAEPRWATPVLWRSELRNILIGYVRRGALSFESAVELQHTAQEMLYANEFNIDSRSVLQLARQSGCSAYDCEFVALAQQTNSRLYTVDKKVLKAFPDLAKPLTK
jgi:predicted nucleic acid-binding protein